MKIAICGDGQSGKGTASAWLREHTELRYLKSTSEAAAELVWLHWGRYYRYGSAGSYGSCEECFADRRNHRQTWAEIIWNHNQPHGVTLYADMVRAGNEILEGIRRASELRACYEHGIINLSIYIDRPDVPPDPSNEITPADCDFTLINTPGDVGAMFAKLEHLARCLGVLKK